MGGPAAIHESLYPGVRPRGLGKPGESRRDDHGPSVVQEVPLRSGLARQPPHLLLRRPLRSRAARVPLAARHQRRPRGAGAWLRVALAPRHGDHHLRARRRAGAQGQHGERVGDPSRRRPAHERRYRRRAQREQSVAQRASALPADLDRARPARPFSRVRAEGVLRGGPPGQAPAGRLAGWPRRVGERPPGRVRVRGVARAGRPRRPPGSTGPALLGARRPRLDRPERPDPARGRRGRRLRRGTPGPDRQGQLRSPALRPGGKTEKLYRERRSASDPPELSNLPRSLFAFRRVRRPGRGGSRRAPGSVGGRPCGRPWRGHPWGGPAFRGPARAGHRSWSACRPRARSA